ncbi:hypothetical protein BKA93DRAFT_741844 [Sparassis latifolia]|uniref:CCD97-like C-terminal domain-containing protein n=1 Tax=Sparassis crispa TaxID=139825 RepID=A0A401GB75_9APHY|nr:predicted protein [Sparassis crispa]GBE79436.1 predicted protein [Sparassis crispa]
MSGNTPHAFKGSLVLSYLGLPEQYEPSPNADPIQFLLKHLLELPPHLSMLFSSVTTPKQRTVVSAIRNRRLRYTETDPVELRFASSKVTWPTLWGNERPGQHEAADERDWVEREFLGSLKPHVGKLGMLLGGYEEERALERIRTLRREQAELLDSLPEEDESEDEDNEEQPANLTPEASAEDAESLFLRSVKERFIYGLLESIDYDKVDWDERWDTARDRDAEERWFDDEEEGIEVTPSFPEE